METPKANADLLTAEDTRDLLPVIQKRRKLRAFIKPIAERSTLTYLKNHNLPLFLHRSFTQLEIVKFIQAYKHLSRKQAA
ncbi:hypothetical protein KW782_00910 [Candidatus Parcubacteria bacterium]|nr:hypothetical protein [Candidatus Parcubacteria bacterium]